MLDAFDGGQWFCVCYLIITGDFDDGKGKGQPRRRKGLGVFVCLIDGNVLGVLFWRLTIGMLLVLSLVQEPRCRRCRRPYPPCFILFPFFFLISPGFQNVIVFQKAALQVYMYLGNSTRLSVSFFFFFPCPGTRHEIRGLEMIPRAKSSR